MAKYHYDRFNPDEAVKLSDARYKWGPSEIVEEAEDLVRRGFRSPMRLYYDFDKEKTPQYIRHTELLADLHKRTIDLLSEGKFMAFGITNEPLAGYQYIRAELWQAADINFEEDIIEFKAQPESKISNIVLFKRSKKSDKNANSRIPHAPRKEREEKYKARLKQLEASGDTSSREEDYVAMNELCDGRVITDHITELRAKFLSEERREGGRPKLGQKNPDEL